MLTPNVRSEAPINSRIVLLWICFLGYIASAVVAVAQPTITQQPVSVSVVSGQPATFTVAATGTGTCPISGDGWGSRLTVPWEQQPASLVGNVKPFIGDIAPKQIVAEYRRLYPETQASHRN